jgi:uncharacterized membrane protein (UPF0127 family)
MRVAILYSNADELTNQCSICTNFFERARGLLCRAPLTRLAGDALLIPKCNSIHTFWMKYSIGVIFLDAQKKILSIHPHVPPRRVVTHNKARFAVEVASGNLWLNRLQVGNFLYWQT